MRTPRKATPDDSNDIAVTMDSNPTSLYVKIFQNIQDVVMELEGNLFNLEEQVIFTRFKSLSYNAQYLFVRLCLCKRGKWHTLSSLEQRYKKELGDKQSISQAIDELAKPHHKSSEQDTKTPIVIDLTLSDDEQAISSTEAPRNFEILAEDETTASLRELLEALTSDELKLLVKHLRVGKPGQTRLELIQATLSQSMTQTTLSLFLPLKPRNLDNPTKKRPLSASSSGTKQASIVRLQVLKMLGRCIRIPSLVFSVIDRLNILYFRSTEYDTSLFLPALLSSFNKRRHASVEYCRTPNIFVDRQAIVNYQDALLWELKLEEMFSSPLDTRSDRARAARNTWQGAYDRWKELFNGANANIPSPILRRFHEGHVLTRVVQKGLDVLAALREYETEVEVLKALLGQTIWGIGKRGAWYDRLALILMTYFGDSAQMLEQSIDIVVRGLKDDNTHLIYRPRLQRRLARLENKLNIPFEQRHHYIRILKTAHHVTIEGIRLHVNKKSDSAVLEKWASKYGQQTSAIALKGKTIWAGKDGSELSVEELALEYYSTLGFKGIHSEGRILTTLFGLLFWDIIFSRIPGAFETPYQSAPLDMLDDSFYMARRAVIEERLQMLREGGGKQILERTIMEERDSQTICIGVDWTLTQDLVDIFECLGGNVLANICRTLSEDYGRWKAGVPDLLLWNEHLHKSKFVEVKSPNDILQENQKVWIDILLGAGAEVDLCHVADAGQRPESEGSLVKRKGHRNINQDDFPIPKRGRR